MFFFNVFIYHFFPLKLMVMCMANDRTITKRLKYILSTIVGEKMLDL